MIARAAKKQRVKALVVRFGEVQRLADLESESRYAVPGWSINLK
eukprot:COSAG01_NODE_59258_length_301_cov_0.836634_1_plen_44_part_00